MPEAQNAQNVSSEKTDSPPSNGKGKTGKAYFTTDTQYLIYIYIYTYIICILYVYMYIYIYTYIYIYIYTCVYIYIDLSLSIYIYDICIHTNIINHTHIYIYIYTYIYIHITNRYQGKHYDSSFVQRLEAAHVSEESPDRVCERSIGAPSEICGASSV